MAKFLTDLPAELILRILCSFDSPIDVANCGSVSRLFHKIISANLSCLARPKCHFSVWFAERKLQISADNSNVQINMDFQKIDECFEKLFRLEILTLTVAGFDTVSDVASSSVKEISAISSFELSSSTLSLSSTECQDENENNFLRSFLTILHRTHQYGISTFVVKNLRVTNDAICANLLRFASQKSCQQIVLKNCEFSAGFREEDLGKMSAICQFTATDCKFGSSVNCEDLFMRKFNHELRYGHRRNMPYFISASKISPSEICNFLNNWLHISESSFFEIRVEDCEPTFREDFLHECERQALSQIFMEFPSRARPNAHVKAKYKSSERLFQIFSVVDAITNSATCFSRDLCYASYFRDF